MSLPAAFPPVFFVFLWLLSTAAPASIGRPVEAVVGLTLIDGTGAPPQQQMTILIEGDRIARIGPAASVTVPTGARVIEASGKYAVPGFIDAHIHYRDYYPELLITHGITGAVDWGGSPLEWILAQKEGIAKGKIYGPRIFTCGDSLSRSEIPDVETARRRVSELAASGVDHVALTFGVAPDIVEAVIDEASRHGIPVAGYPVHTREAIQAGIDAIKHTYVLGSANTTDPVLLREIHRQATLPDNRARDARLFLLGDDFQELVRLMVAHRVAWVPTLVKDFKLFHRRRDEFEADNLYLLSHPELQYLPVENFVALLTNRHRTGIPVVASGLIGTVATRGEEYQAYRKAYANLQGFLVAFVGAGGRVLAGTAPHSFVLPGLSLHQEMQLFVDAGLAPMQALQSATAWVASYLGVADELGTLEEGKLADLVILADNPLQDIRYTRSIERVIQGGRSLPIGYHRSYRNPIPRNTSRNAPGAGYPVPVLDSIDPPVTTEGVDGLRVRATGRRFVSGAVMYFEGIPLTTTFVSGREIHAKIPEDLLRRVGTFWLSVQNPRPGGGFSESRSLIVKFR